MIAEVASTAAAATLAETTAEEAMRYAVTLEEALNDARAAYKEQGSALQAVSNQNEALALAFDDEDAARGRQTARSNPSEPEFDAATAQVVALSLNSSEYTATQVAISSQSTCQSQIG